MEAALADVDHGLALAEHPAADHPGDAQVVVAGGVPLHQQALQVGQGLRQHGGDPAGPYWPMP